ncbi:hypothetical protein PS838_03046 [Pseudomonas fluorescens]|nr:hypothetical protein PS838_03046 [Pseudomonas fluorescens]
MKISDLIPERSMVSTSIGELYVRYLSAGDFFKLSGIEKEEGPEVIGNKVLQLLVSKSSDNSSRYGLSDEDYAALSDADFKKIIPVAGKQCQFKDPEGLLCIDSFGAAIRSELEGFVNRSKKISKSFASVLNPDTLSQYRASLEGVNNVTERIRQSIALKHSFDNKRSVELAEVELKAPKHLDFSAMPENRAAKATEKSAETLEKMSDLLLEMAGSVGTVTKNLMGEVVPEYLSSLDESRISATRTLRITVAGLVVSALLSVSLTAWQVYLSSKSGEESGAQAKEALATLHRQLEASKSSQEDLMREFAIQRQQNEELNARLITALKTKPAPVIRVIKVASNKMVKPKIKNGQGK